MKQEVFEIVAWIDFKNKIKELIDEGYIIDAACYSDYGGVIVAHEENPTYGPC